jgi:hypothetical protein
MAQARERAALSKQRIKHALNLNLPASKQALVLAA